MVSDALLKLIRCPVHGEPLVAADADLLRRINERIASGEVANRAGRQVEQSLEAALWNAGHGLAYPVCDDIPCLLPDEALALQDLAGDDS